MLVMFQIPPKKGNRSHRSILIYARNKQPEELAVRGLTLS